MNLLGAFATSNDIFLEFFTDLLIRFSFVCLVEASTNHFTQQTLPFTPGTDTEFDMLDSDGSTEFEQKVNLSNESKTASGKSQRSTKDCVIS